MPDAVGGFAADFQVVVVDVAGEGVGFGVRGREGSFEVGVEDCLVGQAGWFEGFGIDVLVVGCIGFVDECFDGSSALSFRSGSCGK